MGAVDAGPRNVWLDTVWWSRPSRMASPLQNNLVMYRLPGWCGLRVLNFHIVKELFQNVDLSEPCWDDIVKVRGCCGCIGRRIGA